MKNPMGRYISYPRRKRLSAAKEVTHESIAEDLAAFKRGGGQIERLGITQTLKHIGVASAPAHSGGDKPSPRMYLQEQPA
jgi:hypothetical protein